MKNQNAIFDLALFFTGNTKRIPNYLAPTGCRDLTYNTLQTDVWRLILSP